jgi:hypothetical protein
MLKRVALMFAATAALAMPTTGAFAADTKAEQPVLPEEGCLAIYPQAVQPVLCGKGEGGPGKAG